MYPEELVRPMKAELESAGFTSLHTIEEVDAALAKEGTILSTFSKERATTLPAARAARIAIFSIGCINDFPRF